LPEYLDGDLPAFWKRRLGAHLEHCPDCRLELTKLGEVVQAVKAHPVSEPEPAFWEEFGRELHLKLAQVAPAAPPVRRRYLPYYLLGAPALAALVLWAATHLWQPHTPVPAQYTQSPAPAEEVVYVGLEEGVALEQEEDFTDWSVEPVLADLTEQEREALLKKIRNREKDGSCAVLLCHSSLA
jgi:hypothetical protein